MSPPGDTAGGWEQARNILCVRLDNLGDLLMTTPALRALKAGHPDRRLCLLGSPAACAAAPYVAELDEAIDYAAPWVKQTGAAADRGADLAMIEHLRGRRFDAAVIFTVYSQNPLPAALFCHLAGIPLRLAHSRENPYQLLSHWLPETEPQQRIRHEVRRQLDLVASVGASSTELRLSFAPQPQDYGRVHELLHRRGLQPEGPWLLVHPGATAPSRRYPARGFAQAIELLLRRGGPPVVFAGSAQEQPLVEEIREQIAFPTSSLAGELSLGQCGAAIGLASVLLANNSGPVHLAAALGTPVVDLYALTNPQHTPWQVPSRVLFQDVPCRFCFKSVCPQGHHRCLEGVTPEQVAEAVESLLEPPARPMPPPLPGLAMEMQA
jgi:lipopolysaccharide heptosyltransferase II